MVNVWNKGPDCLPNIFFPHEKGFGVLAVLCPILVKGTFMSLFFFIPFGLVYKAK